MTKKVMKTMVLALLSVAVLFVAGCGKSETTKLNKDAIYREESLKLQLPEGFEVCDVTNINGTFYGYGYIMDDVTYETQQSFFTMKEDGSDYKSTVVGDTNAWIDSMLPLSDGSAILLYSTYVEDLSDPESYDYTSYYYIARYGADGTKIKEVDISDKTSWVNSSAVFSDDTVLLRGDTDFFVYDKDLNLVKSAEAGEAYINGIYTLKDGTSVAYYWSEESEGFKKFDKDKLELTDEVETSLSFTNYTITQGNGKYDLLLRDTTSLYGYNFADAEPKEICNFLDSDVSTSYFNNISFIDDTTFIGIYYDWEDEASEGGLCVSKYTKVDPKDVAEKEIITLGCLYLDSDVRKQVIKFNKENPTCRITVKDYSMYDTEDDWEAGENKFNSDIASGNAPDIVVASDTSTIHNYISKGLYVDIKPFIESDPDISLDNLFPNVVDACSVDGHLYEIVPSFYISTVAAKTSLLKGMTSWNMDQMLEFEKTIPNGSELFYGTTREEFIDNMLTVNSEAFVDTKNTKCKFDSKEFIGLLEYAAKLPEGDDDYYEKLEEDGFWDNYDSLWRTDTSILSTVMLDSFRGYNQIQKGTFGEDITFIGYPTEEGNGSAIYYYFSLGISSKCKHKDEAWQFARTYLLPDYQDKITYGIPITLSRFDVLSKEAKERPFYMDGDQKVYEDDTFYMNGDWVNLEPCTDAEVQKFSDFVKSVTKIQGSLSSIISIIDEESQAFYEGQKSSEEVAKIIQSRASIYINEKQ